ncbi:MAG: response regulator [Aquamicrobium sp.]|uniref:sensor histidine kinase n=1 Tax=Mesorhizobium sp. Pch-S TaxID=2082387 RepID=UPI00101155F1|nr:response regulator [Mesorhizobium sp. Pch-S]MBR2692383.1 response regulator [Aquamicrobium sp.]QAZ46257.1 hybrid sensor histidine kinase/response regulator [Mesorhizobium sp. Pch-S]
MTDQTDLQTDFIGDDIVPQGAETVEKKRVLIVDDDEDFAASLAGLLELEGYQAIIAHDALSAQDALALHQPAIALVDVRLGVGNGVELVRTFRRQSPDLICLMVTAYASVETAVEALQAGAYDYLCKPFHSADLLATLERCFERTRLMEEKRLVAERLGQMQRIQTMGQLAGGIAHDFNNILAVLLGNLRWLQEHVRTKPEQVQMLDDALAAVKAGTDLTTRLLNFGRQDGGDAVRVDLHAVMPDLMRVLRRTLGDDISLSLELADDLHEIEVHPAQMETSLLNLALNARDAMPDGGRLRFEACNFVVRPDDARVASGLLPGQYVVISVIDTGHGMPVAVRRRALEPLFSTKPAGKGNGLGLTMVDGFVRQSGGRLGISSKPDEGTRINLYLPRASVPTLSGEHVADTANGLDELGVTRVVP